MPKLVHVTPRYRKHKASGQAVVTLSGVDHYLGPHGTRASRRSYDRVLGEWLAGGRAAPATADPNGLTIVELCARYWVFAKGHYRHPDGTPTTSVDSIRYSIKLLKGNYAETSAAAFGPIALAAVRQQCVAAGNSRRYANDVAARIRRIFRWGTTQELLPIGVYQSLAALPGLQRGRTDAREPEPIGPVDDGMVDDTIRHLPATVGDMVRLQRLTGMRPQEVCLLKPADIDRSTDVWEFRPSHHKTAHRGRERVVPIGPKAQAILSPYLLRDANAFCFSPAETVVDTFGRRHDARKTPQGQGNGLGTNRIRRKPKRTAGIRYVVAAYRRAISRACDKAFPAPEDISDDDLRAWRRAHRWSPNQLRHSAATAIRKQFGLEAAQVLLGHAEVGVTQIYAERDQAKASAIAWQVG